MQREPVTGLGYCRTLADISGAWWRLVVVVVTAVVGLLAGSLLAIVSVTSVARQVGYPDFTVDSDDGVNAGEMLALNLGLGSLILVAGLMVRLLYGVRPRWLSSTRPGIRWTWLLACVGMALVVWSLFLVLGTGGALASRETAIDGATVAFVGVVLLTTPLQAAGEEYGFRGLLLQAFGATRLPSWACCIATGVLFATAHLQFDPQLFADRMLLGTVLAVLVIQTGGLEASIAVHLVKNVSVLIPAGLLDDAESALDPSAVSWLPLIFDAVLLAIVVPWILYAGRGLVRQERGRRLSADVGQPSV